MGTGNLGSLPRPGATTLKRENYTMAEQHDPEEILRQLRDDLQNKENEITQKTSEREVIK